MPAKKPAPTEVVATPQIGINDLVKYFDPEDMPTFKLAMTRLQLDVATNELRAVKAELAAKES